MKTNLLTGGLSARRKTIDLILRSTLHASSRLVLVIMMAVIALTSCHDKPAKQATTAVTDSTSQQDTLSKPTTDISVNRRYDNKGHLIGFDSTYISYYSSRPGDTTRLNGLPPRLDAQFSKGRSSWFNNRVNTLFNDPLFENDFMIKRYRPNDANFREQRQSITRPAIASK